MTGEVTGVSRRVITESKDVDLRPTISVRDVNTGHVRVLPAPLATPGLKLEARYLLPVGANITVADGDEVSAGDVIAKVPKETTKMKDITGGLPRVAELFEARKPKEHAVISEIDGIVTFGKATKGKRKLVVTPEGVGEKKEYLIPKGARNWSRSKERSYSWRARHKGFHPGRAWPAAARPGAGPLRSTRTITIRIQVVTHPSPGDPGGEE